MAGAAEDREQFLRKRDIGEHHVLVQRRVAEQHVDELPGVVPDGLDRERDADLEQIGLPFGNALDAADELGLQVNDVTVIHGARSSIERASQRKR